MRWVWIIGLVAITGWLIIGCGVDTGEREGWLQDPFSYYPGITPPAGSGGGGGVPTSNPGNYDQMEQEVFDLVNQERQKAGRSPLGWCDGLADLARCHSHDMCKRDFFSHVNPEGEDPTARGRAGHAGSFTCNPVVPNPYRFGVGENIAYGFDSPQSVMQAWMNSPGHRSNILSSNYTHIGVGNCGGDLQGHKGCGMHWTQNFGARMNP
ncbi:MAG: hypothetical protein DRP63_00910 [Planctomycetota bacterium]|nr:MAG: hypothetical protein DRP63_00910 [Planctomycetota bacterium]